MKMRKSISKIMALLLAVTVMASMISIPAMASGTVTHYDATKIAGNATPEYTRDAFVADMTNATYSSVLDFEDGSVLPNVSDAWSKANIETNLPIKGAADKTLGFKWSTTKNASKFKYISNGYSVSGDKFLAVNSAADDKAGPSTITLDASALTIKPTAIAWTAGWYHATSSGGKKITAIVTYNDGTTDEISYSAGVNQSYFFGFKAPIGKWITKVDFKDYTTAFLFDDIGIILEKVVGASMTDYTLADFTSSLNNAEHKIVVNFDGDELTTDFANADSDGWLKADIVKNYLVSDEKIRFTWQSSKFRWIEDTATAMEYVVSGTKCFSSGTGDTYLTFSQNGDFKIVELGLYASIMNASNPPTFTVYYSNGETTVISDAMAKRYTPYFYGFKAPEGEYITRLKVNANTNMFFDDVCVILEDQSVDYSDLEYATEMLQIYGDNFTEYVPLDAFGAQQDANTNRVTISWASSDTNVVTTDGKVYPVVGVEKKVTLTATLTDAAGNTATKEFTVTIPAVTEYVIEGVKITGADGLIDTQLVAGKKIEKISVKRYENSRESIAIVTALYDSQKKMEDVKIEIVPVTISAQAHGDITLSDPLVLPNKDLTGYTAKVMVLNNTQQIVPLCPAYTVNPMSQNITVFMVGDSLTADYTDYYYPRTGWGSCVDDYINGITVDNIAVSGMSTKTFMSNGTKLPYLEENVKEGDYIFLMYGHNDQKIKSIEDEVTENGIKTKKWVNQHSGIGTYGEVDGDTLSYFGYISNIVKVAREKKANIVFFTQFARATNGLEGLLGYPAALTAFATQQNLPVIDTTTPSLALYDKLLEKGEELVAAGKATDEVSFANNIFLHLTKDDPRYINDSRFTSSSYHTKEDDSIRKDNTHFNLYGAQVRARLAVLGLIDANNALARFENVTEADFNALCESVVADILATEYYGKAN